MPTLTPQGTLWRLVRVPRVVRRVVVGVAHRERRASGQHQGRDVAIDVLPFQVPILDVDQRLRGSVRERGDPHDLPRPVMRVRLDGLHLHVNGQHERIRDDVILLSGGDVDVLPAQPQGSGRSLRRIVCEVQAD